MKIGWQGFWIGAMAGLVGAILTSEYSWSLFSVGIAGAVVGLVVVGISRVLRK